TINDFIWKPASERNGLLVVLVNPVNTRIVVTGTTMSETLLDSGPSNGRGTTGRSTFSGASFGNGVKVEFFDSTGARILVADGRRWVDIPIGAHRLEFKF
ncbi:MAG: hypothetical protein KDD62_04100, partial [Bdellovibrionales bacterium]|nr:hypothetical protein [Bdellovibrionales bacterium]